MKKIPLLFVAIIVFACTPPLKNKDVESESNNFEKSITLANAYINHMIAMEYDSLPKLLNANAGFYGPGINDSSYLEGNLLYWKSMREWFDNKANLNLYSKYAIYDKSDDADWVFIRGTIEGLHIEFKKKIKVYVFADFKIKNDKISQINVCWDGLDLLTQLGYIFKAPAQ